MASTQVPPEVPRPSTAPPGMALARWLYVDEGRRHEVYAGMRPGPPAAFVVKEMGYRNEDPGETYEHARPMREEWEAQLNHWELEARLAIAGTYWRYDLQSPGWMRLRPNPGVMQPDLRPAQVPVFHQRAAFHHFHQPALKRDLVVACIPQDLPQGRRWVLARCDLGFPDAADGQLELLHPRLPEGPVRSLLVREHLDARNRSYRKLVMPIDFRLVHGERWQQELDACYRAILTRLAEGRLGSGAAAAPRERPADSSYTDYARWLADPKVAALHARYLEPGEEEALLRGGGPAIRRAVRRKRERVPADEQHLLTVLEASLLARDGLRAGQRARVDPEVAALVRRFAFYL